jgi:hypothetical protein
MDGIVLGDLHPFVLAGPGNRLQSGTPKLPPPLLAFQLPLAGILGDHPKNRLTVLREGDGNV